MLSSKEWFMVITVEICQIVSNITKKKKKKEPKNIDVKTSKMTKN